MSVYLNRVSSDLFGVYGLICKDKKPICHTYELPWRENNRNVSCIPDGTYRVIKASSPRFGSVFYFRDVPGRSGILIHPGNKAADTQGCILPGLDVHDTGVLYSKDAMVRLYKELPAEFDLIVRSVKDVLACR